MGGKRNGEWKEVKERSRDGRTEGREQEEIRESGKSEVREKRKRAGLMVVSEWEGLRWKNKGNEKRAKRN